MNQRCAVHTCNRTRRPDRPVCNRCLRRVGDTILTRWFATRAVYEKRPNDDHAYARLIGVQNTMILNATAYQQIWDEGQRPQWNPIREVWENPRHRARAIIARHYPHLEVGTTDHLADLIAELYPPDPRSPTVKRSARRYAAAVKPRQTEERVPLVPDTPGKAAP